MLINTISDTISKLLDANGRNLDDNSIAQGLNFNLVFLSALFLNLDKLDQIYTYLEDDYSKSVFKWYVQMHLISLLISPENAMRILPPPFLDSSSFMKGLKNVSDLRYSDYFLIHGIKVKTTQLLLYCTFILKQYQYKNLVVPKKGDYVIDGGGCHGETAIWFSKLIGQTGNVISFEPQLDNLNILKDNISRNNITNITAVPLGLLNGEKSVQLTNNGSSSAIIKNSNNQTINMITLDSYVKSNDLVRVDYIKLDIEGSEILALEGMKHTIQKFQPKLAISVYHLGNDIITIPEYIKSIQPKYKIYLDHFTPGCIETIMFFSL